MKKITKKEYFDYRYLGAKVKRTKNNYWLMEVR